MQRTRIIIKNTLYEPLRKGQVLKTNEYAYFHYLGRSSGGYVFDWVITNQIEWSKTRYISFFKIIDELDIFVEKDNKLKIYIDKHEIKKYILKILYKKDNKIRIKKMNEI
jgi:hypothetical protein